MSESKQKANLLTERLDKLADRVLRLEHSLLTYVSLTQTQTDESSQGQITVEQRANAQRAFIAVLNKMQTDVREMIVERAKRAESEPEPEPSRIIQA